MKAAIISIGDEILIGQTVDTNSAWIAARLNEIGLAVVEMMTISDEEKHIVEALDLLLDKADIILMTGGLGPTNDDITKNVLTNYFEDDLVLDEDVHERIKRYFDSINRPMLEVHHQQALLPKKAKVVKNDLGTASGMWFKKNGKHVFSMPGVPYEMKALMTEFLVTIRAELDLVKVYHRTVHFQGIGESTLADQLADFEQSSIEKGLKIAYLPSVGIVKIRITGTVGQKDEIDQGVSFLRKKYPKHAFGEDNERLEKVIGKILSDNGKTVGTVESCTGGNLAGRIVSVSGSSTYFEGSIISYSNEVKSRTVGVPEELIDAHGAVSEEVVESMAINGRKKLSTDYSIATSGVAGPDGGTDKKPVGTVWIAVASEDHVYSRKFQFRHNRERNIESTVVFALNFLRRVILGYQNGKKY